MRRIARHTLATVLLGTALGSTAHAQVAVTTFGPGDSYDPTYGWTVMVDYPAWGRDTGLGWAVAAGFTPSLTGALETVRVAAWRTEVPQAGPMKVSLYAGANMSSATLVEAFTTQLDAPGYAGIASFASVVRPTVTAGQTYWLALSVLEGRWGMYAWNYSAPLRSTSLLEFWNRNTNYVWAPYPQNDQAPAFDVTVTALAAPEPMTIALVATGMAAIGAAARLRRRIG